MKPLIQTLALQYQYGRGQRLHFPDICLGAGQHLLLRGASGSGKSTWLALLAGLLSPSGGQVLMAGQDLQQLGVRRRDAWRGEVLGFVPQRLHLSAALTVLNNLLLPFVSVGQRPDLARAQALLVRLGLADLAQRRPHQLSLGQAQRVALARALMRRPRLLLADEPSANLDDGNTAQMMDLLLQSASECGASLLLATHDGRLAAQAERAGGFQTLSLGGSQ